MISTLSRWLLAASVVALVIGGAIGPVSVVLADGGNEPRCSGRIC